MNLMHGDIYSKCKGWCLKGHRDTGKRTEAKTVLAKMTLQQLLALAPFMHLCYVSMESIFSNHKTRAWSSPSSLLAEGLSGGELLARRGWHSSQSSAVAARVQSRSHSSSTLSHCRKETESYPISESRTAPSSLVMKQKLAEHMLLCSRQGGHSRHIREVFI